MTEALVKVQQPRTQGAIILRDALQVAAEQRSLLVRFVKEQMVEGVDYGTIPGTPKPCLYKPGAEKLTELYRSSVSFSISKEVEDWEKGFFYYRIKAKVISRDTGSALGVGYGSCNSRETKYRWRDAKIKCPACAQETVFKSKKDGGWFCWDKKGGCGTNFHAGDARVERQPRGRVENPDIADLVNTILKMATKRAHVAAALQLAGCSDLFTQDLEDMPIPPMPPPLVEAPRGPSRTESVKNKLKAGMVVDVQPGESEEQATERVNGLPDINSMSRDALTDKLMEMAHKLQQNPKARNRAAVEKWIADAQAALTEVAENELSGGEPGEEG